jgi:hypothetical protein
MLLNRFISGQLFFLDYFRLIHRPQLHRELLPRGGFPVVYLYT